MNPYIDSLSLSEKLRIKFVMESVNHETILFYGHIPKNFDMIDKSCLSQWFPSEFTHESVTYKTAEHFMMYHKAIRFGDLESAEKIISSKTPKEAKALGRKVKGFDQKEWEEYRYNVVRMASFLKFSKNEKLRRFLLGTGDALLVEASPYDRIWGIGLSINDPSCNDIAKWRGSNLLGFALVDARNRIRINEKSIIASLETYH